MGQEPYLNMLAEIRELQSLLQEEWPARRAALHASGVPLMEGDDDDGDGTGGDGSQDAPPPWGDDFDPKRAWHTIQKLRERETEADRLRAELKKHEDAQ
jgi:hypothetical protein